MTELWGLGDLALAMPFLRTATQHAKVTLLAKPQAAALLQHFAPEVELVPLVAPWTAFRGKYRLHRWPWRTLRQTIRTLRHHPYTHAISARPDPREHAFLKLTGAEKLVGFPHAGSQFLVNEKILPPLDPHRAACWQYLAGYFGWTMAPAQNHARPGRQIVIHTGAAQAVRRWPLERYTKIADQLRQKGWTVTIIDEDHGDLDALIKTLSSADRFIGNDSGPGHIAALLGVPTFTIFGSQLSENFAPQHPQSTWVDGAPCPYKPCSDYCRFPVTHCLHNITATDVWSRLQAWLRTG